MPIPWIHSEPAPFNLAAIPPPKDRYGLTLNGEPTYATCAPLATGMMTAYWHQQRPPAWGELQPQTLIDANASLFTERGIGIHQFEDDLRSAGYNFRTFRDTDFGTLRQVAGRQPVIAHVRTGFEPGGMPHAVVVYKMDEDNVYVADPSTATEYAVPVPQFQRVWETATGEQGGTFYTIAPSPSPWKEAKKQAGKQEVRPPVPAQVAQQQRPAWRRGR